MRRGRHSIGVLGASVALVLLAWTPARILRAEEPEEWEREAGPEVFYVSPVDAEGTHTHVILRVVDSLTGDPLPGASGALYSQDDHPITGLVPPDRMGIADAEGWLRIRADDLEWGSDWIGAYWTYLEAPGHAGVAVNPGAWNQVEFRLVRAESAVVQVLDSLDRPIPGAVIGVRDDSTCGHMPDQRVAMTGLDGIAVLPNLCRRGGGYDCTIWECWVVADGIQSTYHDLLFPTRRPGPQVLRHQPSRPIEGVILDTEGKPMAGAHVGVNYMHRGPWTKSDSEGRFRIVGAPLGARVDVVEEYEGMYAQGHAPSPDFTPPPAGFRRIFRMPPTGKALVEEAAVEVTVVARDRETGETLRDAPIVAVRDGDGWTRGPDKWDNREECMLAGLPAGSFTVLAGGGLSPYALAKGRIEVKSEAPPPLTIDVIRHPAVRVAYEGDVEKAFAVLVSADEERDVSAEELRGGHVPVPAGVECAFVLRPEEGGNDKVLWNRLVRIPPDQRGPDSPVIRLRPARRVAVKARLAGPDGKEVPGWLDGDVERLLDYSQDNDWEPDTEAQAEPTALLFAEGTVDVLVVPKGRALAPRVVRVPIPPGAEGGAPIDAGVVRLEPRGDRRLFVQRADGSPSRVSGVRIVRDGVVRMWTPSAEGEVCDPALLPLAPGDEVVVAERWEEHDRFERTIRMRLVGEGPWTIRGDASRASLALDATDEAGEPLDEAALVIDGRMYEGEAFTDDDGNRHPLEVTGLAPGPHTVAVCAANRLTRLYRVVLKDGERRLLTPRLHPAPPLPAPK